MANDIHAYKVFPVEAVKWLRRVQHTGTGHVTFLITLPRSWCKAVKLRKGTILTITLLSDGSLRVHPPGGENKNGWSEP